MNIFDIQHSSYHDGPGIRTVVFLKGCNLRCFWCQNPESQISKPEIMYYPNQCIGCQKCVHVCMEGCHTYEYGKHEFDRNPCIACGNCAENCYAESLVLSGKQREEEDIYLETLKDLELYQLSGGGVTLSGGEPLLQYKSCEKLLRLLKSENIHTLIETAGYVSWEAFETVLQFTDYFYYDVKIADSQKHKQYCGESNERIIDNLIKLSERTSNITVRVPIITGINDNEKEIEKLVEMIQNQTKVTKMELIPFHKLGKGKYDALGRKYGAAMLESPSIEKMQILAERVRAYEGIRNISCDLI